MLAHLYHAECLTGDSFPCRRARLGLRLHFHKLRLRNATLWQQEGIKKTEGRASTEWNAGFFERTMAGFQEISLHVVRVA